MTTVTPSTGVARRSLPREIALVAVFTAFVAVLSLTPAIPVGALGVPITLQTLAVALTALLLGAKRGALAVLLYVVVGLAGLPVFAQFSGGPGVLAAPSAGYLLSFPVAALVVGGLSTAVLRKKRRFLAGWLFLCALAGSVLVVHPAGILGMSINAHIPLSTAAVVDMAYWPGDLVKSALAAVVAAAVLRAFPALGRRSPSAL